MHPSVLHILHFFEYGHLPEHLAKISKLYADLATELVGQADTWACKECGAVWRLNDDNTWSLVSEECMPCCDNVAMDLRPPGLLPANPETTVALRKLLESKDAAVRAVVAGPASSGPRRPATMPRYK